VTRICSTEEVAAAVRAAREGARAYCTNFFPSPDKLAGWIRRGALQGAVIGETACFLQADRDFHHLYFCAPDLDRLVCTLTALPEIRSERVVLDFVGQPAAVDAAMPALEHCGFRRYTRLIRMARVASVEITPMVALPVSAAVSLAVPDDTADILRLLEGTFNRYAEQLPTAEEVAKAVHARQIMIVRDGVELAGLLYYEAQGVSAVIRYWLVASSFRGRGVGSALMHACLATNQRIRRFVLWVLVGNTGAIARYRHYAFVPDGLTDDVWVNERIAGCAI